MDDAGQHDIAAPGPDTMHGPALQGAPLLVVGAGIMGAGIAQVAAQAGHAVLLFDTRDGAAAAALAQLATTLQRLVSKGKLTGDTAAQTLARISVLPALPGAAGVRLVVEAIVEDLEAKRGLFRQLEGIVAADAVLATNTSSISVTAIANGLAHPERVVGMHFFNPVPLMKLVEVVHGLQTAPAVADAIFALSAAWGKVPVHARSTPGFIVNRIARPYYAETLALLHEQAAPPHALDACLVAAGFPQGPCALMDLIGHDTNFAVTRSVFEANFFDRRFTPSLVQRELVDGGLLGRKSGRGFYRYGEGHAGVPALPAWTPQAAPPGGVWVAHGAGPVADWLAAAAARHLGHAVLRDAASGWVGLSADGCSLSLTDGRTATQLAALSGAGDVAVFDRFDPARADVRADVSAALPVAFAAAEGADAAWPHTAAAWLAALGLRPVQTLDTPALVVARTVAMLVNEACDAVAQGVCTEEGADAAMQLGVNHPCGPFQWLRAWAASPSTSAAAVVQLLDTLDAHYRGERYRASPRLRRQALAQRRTTAVADPATQATSGRTA